MAMPHKRRGGWKVMTARFLQEVLCQIGAPPVYIPTKLTFRGYGCSGGDDLSEMSISPSYVC